MPALKPCIKATCCSNVTANTCSSALAVHAIYVVISGAGCQLKRCNIQRVRVFLKPCKCSSIAAPCFFAPFLFLVQKSFFLLGYLSALLIGWYVEHRFVKFSTDCSKKEKAVRILIGFICLEIDNEILI